MVLGTLTAAYLLDFDPRPFLIMAARSAQGKETTCLDLPGEMWRSVPACVEGIGY